MNARKSLLVALGMVSVSAVAQVSSPGDQLQPGHQSQSLSQGQQHSGSSMQSGGSSQQQLGTQGQDASSGGSGMQSGAGSSMQGGARLDTRMLPPAAPMQELSAQTQNGVTWLCGGVGESEESYIRNEARNYDMMLTFAARNGAYMADVNVDIADSRGNSVLQTNCGGPLMLVDLPKGGSYRVRAESDGHTVTRTAKVREGKGQGRMVVMTWPLAAAGIDRDEPSSSVGGSDESGDSEQRSEPGSRR